VCVNRGRRRRLNGGDNGGGNGGEAVFEQFDALAKVQSHFGIARRLVFFQGFIFGCPPGAAVLVPVCYKLFCSIVFQLQIRLLNVQD